MNVNKHLLMSGVPWTPAQLTLGAWYDFSDSSTVTPSGSDITALNDKSGNGFHLSGEGGAGKYPQLVSAAQNGLDIGRFDGSNDYLRRPTVAILKNVAGASMAAMRKVTGVASVRFSIVVDTPTGNASRMALVSGATANKGDVRGRRLDADSINVITGTTTLSTTAHQIQIGVIDYANSDAWEWIDGTQDASSTSFQTNGNTSNTDANSITMGAAGLGGVNFFIGDIGEVLIANSAWDTATRQKVEGYLAWKWGTVSGLPSDHPYKSMRPLL